MTSENAKAVTFNEFLDSIGFKRTAVEELVLEVIDERLSKDISQKELAKIAGTTQSVISRFENLGRQPRISFLQRIATALGATFRGTIHGDYMYVAPKKFHEYISESAEKDGVSTSRFLDLKFTKQLQVEFKRQSWKVVQVNQLKSVPNYSSVAFTMQSFTELYKQDIESDKIDTEVNLERCLAV